MKIEKGILGTTGEYYVAAELGRRNTYAQLTLGNQKRTDLLILPEENRNILKVEVKCKQGNEWPNCKGIYQKNSFIIFVDFKNLKKTDRPVFYILDVKDWKTIVNKKKKKYKSSHPNRRATIRNNVLILWDEVKNGNPHKGCTIIPEDLENFKEKWRKIKKHNI